MTSAHLLPRLILSWLILASLSAQSVVRGPYLQKGTPDSLVLRWRTDSATDSVVRYGMALGSLTGTIRRSGNRTEHEILITGLSSDKRYFYSIGNSAGPLAGDDASYFFQTAPLPGVDKSTRIWVTGDPGTGWSGARALRDKYKNYTGTRGTDLWLMLGDNAYPDGTDSEYQYALFDTYPELLRQVVLWPAFGNHDDNSADSATQSGPYYNIFSLPAQGEAGGVISGTEAYYSFDYGNIHFVCLDSSDSNRSTDGPMLTWLEQDLAANDKKWLIAYWHHPPYSKGTHDSDREANLIEMRQNALPILEAHGVDLVLTGHSHNYERSFLLGGHYGSSSTLQSWMILDSGDGREDGDGVYRKPGQPAQPHQGTVYVVSGNAGKVPGPNGPLNHPVMLSSNVDLGSVVLDINGNRLEAVALDVEGKVRDYFTLRKDEPIGPQPSTTLGQVFMGPLADGSAWTRILVANQDLVACDMEIAFHQDAVVGEAIPTINGRKTESLTATLPPGGLKKFDLTATDELLQGSVTIFAKPPCQPASLSSQGTAFIEQHEHPPPTGFARELCDAAQPCPDLAARRPLSGDLGGLRNGRQIDSARPGDRRLRRDSRTGGSYRQPVRDPAV